MNNSRPQGKNDLLAHIHTGWDDLQTRLNQLTESQMTTPNPQDGWAIKDHLTHLAAWELGIAALLQKEPRYQAMGLDETLVRQEGVDFNVLNDHIFQQHRNKSLAEAQHYLQNAHEALLAALDELTDEDLQRTYSFYEPLEPGEDNGNPIIGWIMGNTYEHYEEHWSWIEAAAKMTR